MDILILFPVFFPLAAALLAYLIGRKSKSARDSFVWAAVAAD